MEIPSYHPDPVLRRLPKILFLFLLLGVLVYAKTLFYPFVHDDVVFILRNPHIDDWQHLSRLFWQRSVSPSDIPIVNPYYRPLLEIVYRLEYRVFGASPFGYHLFNIILHLGNSVLIFLLLRRLKLQENRAAVIAGLFLLHPVQTEAVACVAGISNLLSAFFCLSSLLFYNMVSSDNPGKSRGILLGFSSLLFYALGLLIKEQAAVLPFLLLLPGVLSQRRRPKALLAGFGLLTIFYFVWRKLVLGGFLVPLLSYPYELWLRIAAIPATLLMDLRLVFFPFDLHYYRSIDTLADHRMETLVFILIVLGVVAFYRSIKRRDSPDTTALTGFALGWFFLTLLPTLNILPLINEYSLIAAFEHFLYLPLLGLLLLGSVAWDHALSGLTLPRKKMIANAVLATLICSCCLLSLRQNTFWQGEVPLFERAKRFEPHFGRLRILLGKAYFNRGNYSLALAEYRSALEIMNRYVQKTAHTAAQSFYLNFLKEIYSDMAHCYEALGDLKEVVVNYQRALAVFPGDGEIANNLGVIYLKLQDPLKAEETFRQALVSAPGNLQAKSNLGICFVERGEFDKAEALFQEILVEYPGFTPARQNLSQLLKERSPRAGNSGHLKPNP